MGLVERAAKLSEHVSAAQTIGFCRRHAWMWMRIHHGALWCVLIMTCQQFFSAENLRATETANFASFAKRQSLVYALLLMRERIVQQRWECATVWWLGASTKRKSLKSANENNFKMNFPIRSLWFHISCPKKALDWSLWFHDPRAWFRVIISKKSFEWLKEPKGGQRLNAWIWWPAIMLHQRISFSCLSLDGSHGNTTSYATMILTIKSFALKLD